VRRLLALALALGFASGCGTVLGIEPVTHDDAQQETDAGPVYDVLYLPPLTGFADAPESSVDATDALAGFTSPNGAVWTTGAAGTLITSYDVRANGHPIIFPDPQLTTVSSDYVVTARVWAPRKAEFGILIRIQPDGSTIVFSSMFGLADKAMIAKMFAGVWNPEGVSGVDYTVPDDRHWRVKLQAIGKVVSGKIWIDGTPEPTDWMVSADVPYDTGRGTGFYTYQLPEVYLEEIAVTPL